MRFIARQSDKGITKGKSYRGKFVSNLREFGPPVMILIWSDDCVRRAYPQRRFRRQVFADEAKPV